MSSLGYSGEMSDYYYMDPQSRGGFILHSSNQPMLRQPFSQPIAVHSGHPHLKTPLESQAAEVLAEGLSKPMFGHASYNAGESKSPHLCHGAMATNNKPTSSCLATMGHIATTQQVGRSPVAKEKLTSRQIDSLVSDIFSSDLQYHDSSEHHQQQVLQNVEPPVPSHPAVPVKKRNRKRKEPHQRKIKPAGTHTLRDEIKRRRCRGDEYTTRAGKFVEKKIFRMVDCRCRRNCTAKVPKEVRKRIFEEYHAMADWNSQTQFIVASVVVTDIKRRRPKKIPGVDISDHVSRRGQSRVFYLTSKKVQVCKTVFMSTLGITGKRVDYALRVKAIPMTAIATPDRRGRKEPKNKTSLEVEERIRAHINSFPRVAPGDKHSTDTLSSSHVCMAPMSSAHPHGPPWSSSSPTTSQPPSSSSSSAAKVSSANPKSTFPKHASTNRQALNQLHLRPDLTITKMYQLYQDQCRAEHVEPASMWVYTKVLHAESKFKPAHSRQGHSQTSATTQCKCCDRSYSILTSNESPERKIELLLEEHRARISHSSSSTDSADSLSKSVSSLKTAGKSKTGSLLNPKTEFKEF